MTRVYLFEGRSLDSLGLRQHVLAPFVLAPGYEPLYPGRQRW